MKKLADLQVGDEVFFLEHEANPYLVKVKKGNFMIATIEDGDYEKYTIIDTDREICGPHNRTFNPYNFNKQHDVEACLRDLIANNYGIGLSQRHSANVSEVLDLEKTLAV